VYPEDAYSVESLLAACHLGIETARTASSVRYHQYPAPKASGEDEDIFDTARVGLLRGSLSEPSRLLNLFARLCLDTVPADRVSIMVREADSLVIQVALGFERQDEMIRTTRVPLSGQTVSAWVAQRREPLLVTGADEFAVLHREARASYNSDSFISFPLLEGEELLGVIHFSNRSDGQPFSQADVDAFRPIARVISNYLALDKNFANAQEAFLQNALFGLVDVVERQVPGMENHSAEVARLAEATARQMGYGEAELGRIRVSSRLHDLGYTSFRSRILAESRALSPRERTLAQRHPLLGWSFLESMPIAEIDRDAILYHHEREDGSGYFGKRGADIPATAKILAVADVYQALTSPRPYRPAVPQSEALAYLEGQKGTLFDSGVIEAFRIAVTSIN
jgi:HD-GYP domain-containing protein (c-di-GMP phosphodiesterase class II)